MSPTPTPAQTGFPEDPRVPPMINALSDLQLVHVLRQVDEAWGPGAVSALPTTPADARAELIDLFTLNLATATDREAEHAAQLAMVALATIAHPTE